MKSKRDGIKSSDWKKHSNKEQSRTHNKKVRKAGQKESKIQSSEEDSEEYNQKNNILQFIKGVNDGNYAQSHKYLSDVVTAKVTQRIAAAAEKPLF
jgi:hypothetical protein